MCYQYNREFRRDIKKDEPKETEARPEPRAKAPEFKFWAFPRRSRGSTVEEPATVDRTRAKV
ncbi:hypothetical protein BJQ90_00158 [Arthrobacter sp. SO3]|nr:hypothetical protein [Arthrobacter sp. SO3]MCB5290742.1 hypothetical protein [Arthrobacter sp. SO3]